MNYAYARVSCKDQRLERQLAAFKACGIALIRLWAWLLVLRRGISRT